MREYSTSLGGILSAMASAAQPMSDPYQVLKVTGEWNSKTTEDYIGMCKAEITGSKEIQQDLAYMAGQWRDTVVREIGRERYNELSEQLGGVAGIGVFAGLYRLFGKKIIKILNILALIGTVAAVAFLALLVIANL